MASASSPLNVDDDSSIDLSISGNFSHGETSTNDLESTTTSHAASNADDVSMTSSISSSILDTPVFTQSFTLPTTDEDDVTEYNKLSKDVWNEDRPLRPLQVTALTMAIDPDICRSKLAFIAPTGYGKTHFVRVFGCMLRGVIVIIVPLLSLSADQMKKMMHANQEFGSIEVHNLDEITPSRMESDIIPRINEIKEGTTSTMFLFTSPQHLAGSPDLVEALKQAHERGVLKGIGIDEGHLYVGHSMFRLEIRALKDLIWLQFFPPGKEELHPTYWITTATINLDYVNELEELTGIHLEPSSFLWPDASTFMKDNIDIQISISGDMATHYNKMIAKLAESNSGRVVVFVTSVSDCDKIRKKLESLLDTKDLNSINVITVHGKQTAFEKYWFIRVFCEEIDPNKDFNPRLAVFNGAANTGIDIPDLGCVLRIGFPPNLLSYFQELGRLAREAGASGVFSLVGSITSFLRTIKLIHNQNMNEDTEDFGKGSLFRYKSQESSTNEQTKVDLSKYKPSPKQKKKWILMQQREALDVLKYCCLGSDCKHIQAAVYLSTGVLHSTISDLEECTKCGSRCPTCRSKGKDWFKLFRKGYRKSIINWFESSKVQDVMPLPATFDNNGDNLTALLWKDDDAIMNIFDLKKSGTIKKYHVEALLLQLIAAEIITLKVANNSKSMNWAFNRVKVAVNNDGDIVDDSVGLDNATAETKEVPCYKIDKYWNGVSKYPEDRKRRSRKVKKNTQQQPVEAAANEGVI